MKLNYTMLGCAEVMKAEGEKIEEAAKRLREFGNRAKLQSIFIKYPYGKPDDAIKKHLQAIWQSMYNYGKALEEYEHLCKSEE